MSGLHDTSALNSLRNFHNDFYNSSASSQYHQQGVTVLLSLEITRIIVTFLNDSHFD